MISVVSQKRMVVKTKQFSWFRWLVKEGWWLKRNSFHDFGCLFGFNHHPFLINHRNHENWLVLTTILFWLTTEITKTVWFKPPYFFDQPPKSRKLFGFNHLPFLTNHRNHENCLVLTTILFWLTTEITKTVWFSPPSFFD